MCEVCIKKNGKFLSRALEDHLGSAFEVITWDVDDEYEEMRIINRVTRAEFRLVADGDEGGYFHFGNMEK